MKKIGYLIKSLLLSLLLFSCVEEKNENYDFIQTISDPQNISAEIYVDENTGIVSVTPMGEVWFYMRLILERIQLKLNL